MLTNWIDDHIVFIIPGLIVGVIVLVLLFDAFVRPILDDPGQSDADKE